MTTPEITREAFVAGLRALADAFELDTLPLPSFAAAFHLMGYGEKGRQSFLAARAAFPDAVPTLGSYWVEMPVAPGIDLAFSKDALCTKRTEARSVDVYDIDPELLLPLPEPEITQQEQDRRDAAEDMAMDARAEADQEARDLGYCDDDCRAEIETDAMRDEIAGSL